MSRTQGAISRLAALYEYGELHAGTDPVAFLDNVTKEVQRLRAENERMRRWMGRVDMREQTEALIRERRELLAPTKEGT